MTETTPKLYNVVAKQGNQYVAYDQHGTPLGSFIREGHATAALQQANRNIRLV